MMERKEIISSPEYWETLVQVSLYDCAVRYMQRRGLNRTLLAQQLGVSKSYVSQLLNGNFDHRLSKLVTLALAFGYVPKVEFVEIEQYMLTQNIKEQVKAYNSNEVQYLSSQKMETGDKKWETSTGINDMRRVA